MDYVVDASVIVKWFVPEEESDKAGELRDLAARGQISLHAPGYAVVEVANALALHPFVRLSEEEITDAILASEKMVALVDLTREEWRNAIILAREIPISVYDSAYLAVSLSMDLKFVTADSKLVERLSNKLRSRVLLLRDIF